MFKQYRRIRDPYRIMGDVIEERILKALMRSFYLGECRELIMIDSVRDPKHPEALRLERLHPYDGAEDNRQFFTPFCKSFREDTSCDELCTACDAERAMNVLRGYATGGVEEYACHVGLIDLVYPIQLGTVPRGVLFAGQRVPVWDGGQMRKIRGNVQRLSKQNSGELLSLLKAEESNSADDARKNLRLLKKGFSELGETIQAAVSDSYNAKQANALQSAVAEVVEHLSEADIKGEWSDPVEDVLNELEDLVGHAVIFFVRNGAHYVSRAVSSRVARLRKELRIRAERLDTIRPNQWQTIASELLGESPDASMASYNFKAFRVEKKTDDAEPAVSLSCVMIVMGEIANHDLELPKECCKLFAHHAHAGVFMEKLSFTGHSMKTPIQVALMKLRRSSRIVRSLSFSLSDAAKIVEINEGVATQMNRALIDAQLLEAATKRADATVELTQLIQKLVPEFSALGEDRGVTVVLTCSPPDRPATVVGDESELRIAFSNLLDNAVKYSYRNKEVRIGLRFRGNKVEIEIANYGVGIDPKKREMLFRYGARATAPSEKFERAGSGLGLAQTKQFIEGNRGTITIRFAPESFNDEQGVVIVAVTFPVL